MTTKGRSTKQHVGELIIPLLAIGYAIYTLGDQHLKGIRHSSLLYGTTLAVPLVVCAIIVVTRVILRRMPKESRSRSVWRALRRTTKEWYCCY